MSINWRNIYYMLCYCTEELVYFKDSCIDSEDIKSTNDLLAKLLINSFDHLYRNGYMRRYRHETIVTAKPHGKIDLEKSVSTGNYMQGKLVCKVNTLDVNNRVNQIIKSTICLLINSNGKFNDKIDDESIARLYTYKNILKDVDTIHISGGLINQKMDIPEWYRPIISVCRLIINDWLALDKSGKKRLLELSNKKRLCYIWEKYLRSYIKQRYIKCVVEKRTLHFSNGGRVTPDIVIIDEERKRALIVDAKWYDEEDTDNNNLAELCQNCIALQNEQNLGSEYTIRGINAYAATSKCYVEKPRKADTSEFLYTDSFISVNNTMEDMEKQIEFIVDAGFNLEEEREIIYSV